MVRKPAVLTPGPTADLYDAKARAELAAAESIMPGSSEVATHGDPIASVVLIVGEPSDDERRAHRALAGDALDASRKILAALGVDADSMLAVCSRPVAGSTPEDRARRLEAIVEAVDPALVVALDVAAAEDLAGAFRSPPLRPGDVARARGRVTGWVGDLRGSLADESLKRSVWAAFKALAAAAARPGGAGV